MGERLGVGMAPESVVRPVVSLIVPYLSVFLLSLIQLHSSSLSLSLLSYSPLFFLSGLSLSLSSPLPVSVSFSVATLSVVILFSVQLRRHGAQDDCGEDFRLDLLPERGAGNRPARARHRLQL